MVAYLRRIEGAGRGVAIRNGIRSYGVVWSGLVWFGLEKERRMYGVSFLLLPRVGGGAGGGRSEGLVLVHGVFIEYDIYEFEIGSTG